jgi:hypothetical protein
MSEHAHPSQSNPSSAPADSDLQFDLRGAAIAYANVFRACGTTEEIILDFGLHDQFQAPSDPGVIPVSQRLVLSHGTAQRLADMLHAVLQHYHPAPRPPVRLVRVQPPPEAVAAAVQPQHLNGG